MVPLNLQGMTSMRNRCQIIIIKTSLFAYDALLLLLFFKPTSTKPQAEKLG